jgi:hypothetical protein
MLDVSVSYNRYKFLGYEYLTWLWFVVETDQDRITNLEQGPVSMEIGNRMVLEKKKKDARETITIKGDDAGLEEGMLALRKGALVAEGDGPNQLVSLRGRISSEPLALENEASGSLLEWMRQAKVNLIRG